MICKRVEQAEPSLRVDLPYSLAGVHEVHLALRVQGNAGAGMGTRGHGTDGNKAQDQQNVRSLHWHTPFFDLLQDDHTSRNVNRVVAESAGFAVAAFRLRRSYCLMM